MKYISQFEENDIIDNYFYMRKAEKKPASYGNWYYSFTLIDKTGVIRGYFYPKGNDEDASILLDKSVKYARVMGCIRVYRGYKQIQIEKIRKAESEENFNRADLFSLNEYWRDKIQGENGLDIGVAGLKYYDFDTVQGRIDSCEFKYKREKDNTYDSNAIQISCVDQLGNEYIVGHVPAKYAPTLAGLIDEGYELQFDYKKIIINDNGTDDFGLLLTVR